MSTRKIIIFLSLAIAGGGITAYFLHGLLEQQSVSVWLARDDLAPGVVLPEPREWLMAKPCLRTKCQRGP
jgi:hypothetical protein